MSLAELKRWRIDDLGLPRWQPPEHCNRFSADLAAAAALRTGLPLGLLTP
jgi:hypothetical protein